MLGNLYKLAKRIPIEKVENLNRSAIHVHFSIVDIYSHNKHKANAGGENTGKIGAWNEEMWR